MATVKIERLSDEQVTEKGIRSWPVWEKEVPRFQWTYNTEEQCFIIEGEVIIETEKGNFVLQPGDFVVFEKGLVCVWDIRSAVKKYYHFS